MVRSRRRRRTAKVAAFALLALAVELLGRSITARIDGALHVRPLAAPDASYYPFLLAGVKIAVALGAAALAWRVARARATAVAGRRLLGRLGHRRPRAPRVRLTLDPRLWAFSFVATSLWYLVQTDVDRVSAGSWPLVAPWLHTYALPVFAVLAVLVALGWRAVAQWVAEYEDYAAATIARARRVLRTTTRATRRARTSEVHAPRLLFGLAFECRPPPLLG
jgi:hypothetical protein